MVQRLRVLVVLAEDSVWFPPDSRQVALNPTTGDSSSKGVRYHLLSSMDTFTLMYTPTLTHTIYLNNKNKGEGCSSVVEYLPSRRTPGLIPAPRELGMWCTP